MRNQILLCGTDPLLLSTRGNVLRSVGYEVLTVLGPEKIESTLQTHTVDALVLCHTLTAEEQQALLAALHRHSPEAKTVIMKKMTRQGISAIPDAVVSTGGGPEALIQTLGRLLDRSFPDCGLNEHEGAPIWPMEQISAN